jgi:hypothetical protein
MRVFSNSFGHRFTPGPKLGCCRGPGVGGPGYLSIQYTDTSKRKHPQISAVVTKLPKARFVGADGKLSLARGIPIPLPDHVVSIKPTSADPAPSVVSECPFAHVQPSAHAPSIDPNSGAPSGTRTVVARVAARPAMADPGDLFHEFEPE